MILITGATSGIGEATARAFATNKKNLLLAGRRTERLEALARELSAAHAIQARTLTLDVTDRAAIEALDPALLSEVEILINNAGLAKGMQPIQSGALDDWEAMIDTNFKGLLWMSRAVLPHMIQKKSGHIINIGSVAGHSTYPNGNVYCATKAAVHSLSECLRLDLVGSGIRVTEISPGMVETEFSLVRLGDESKAKSVYRGMTPLSAQDIAESIVWCASRPKHVNVQDLVIYPTDQASPTVVSRTNS
jgi:3-hydroxy acid dehydrogenase/malonic semialdehyde reductase